MRLGRVLVSSLICLCACAGALSAATGATGASGIAGLIVAGPTCPVETIPPQPQCAPRPLEATVRIRRAGRKAERLVRSGADGHFMVRLAPATYVLTPLSRPGTFLPRPPAPFRVRVTAGRYARVTITYDTGIR